jgi:LPXTG-site transpeptidase (sortase) family protein
MTTRRRRAWSTLALGLALGAVGLVCVGGGLGLVLWRLAEPDRALVLPAGLAGTPENTPTPGILGTPLAPPPLPADAAAIVMLPEGEDPTATPSTPEMSPAASETVAPTTIAASATPHIAPTLTGTPSPTAPTLAASATRTPPPTVLAASPTPTQGAPGVSPTAPPPTPIFLRTPLLAAPDHITIPAIGLDAPVVAVDQHPITIEKQVYSQWDVPDRRAAGWHKSSAALGVPGNTVLNGHHNIDGEVFRWLVALKPGSLIALGSHGREYYYVVVQTMTLAEEGQPLAVRQDNARWILPTEDERVTLITCWPYYARTHRLVVIARPLWAVVPPGDIP